MLGLELTDAARAQLRRLRDANPELFATIADRITSIRRDPGGKNTGHTFLLDDGRTARLATFYDHPQRTDICLVWMIREDDDGPLVRVQWVAPFDAD